MYIQGYKIKKEREKKGIKQLTLAEEINVSQSWLSKVESGLSEPNSDKLDENSQVFKGACSTLFKRRFCN